MSATPLLGKGAPATRGRYRGLTHMPKQPDNTGDAGKPVPMPVRNRRGRRNRKRRDWNGPIRRACAVLICVEAVVFLLAYPGFKVRNVRIEGLQTLTPAQAFVAAKVPRDTNIFVMALRRPLVQNLEMLPVVDHASRIVQLPDTIVLRVAERQPHAVLAAGGGFWLIDNKRVPYAQVDGPVDGLPTIQPTDQAALEPVSAGKPIGSDWLVQTYNLLTLLVNKQTLQPKLITVDQNANMCLNRVDNLRINIGSPDDLSTKLWSAEAIAKQLGPDAAAKADYIDVSSPTHTALMLHHDKNGGAHA